MYYIKCVIQNEWAANEKERTIHHKSRKSVRVQKVETWELNEMISSWFLLIILFFMWLITELSFSRNCQIFAMNQPTNNGNKKKRNIRFKPQIS